MTEIQPEMQVTPEGGPSPSGGTNWLVIGLVVAAVVLGVAFVWALLRPPSTSAPTPTTTPQPLPNPQTPQVQPPATTVPCNWAAFVADVTVADDTAVQAGQKFTK